MVLAILSVAFAVVSYSTHWDWWLHDDVVEKLVERFDLSYSNDAAKPIRPNDANVLIMPSVDAANISYNLLRMAAGHGLTLGGILLGAAKPAHILTP